MQTEKAKPDVKAQGSAGEASSDVAKPYQPTALEIEAVSAHNKRRKARLKAPRLKSEGVKDGQLQLAPDHPDAVVWHTALEQAFGTCSADAAALLTDSALGLVHPKSETVDETAR